MRIGLNGPQDVLALLVRRKWWIVAPFIALTCGVAVLTFVLPSVYESEALILVRPRDVSKEFVKDVIAGTPDERLRSIQQQVLSRTILLQILREFDEDLWELKRLNIDEKVLQLRSQINIIMDLEKDPANKQKTLPLTYFRISYSNRSPQLAMKIASKLTTLFIEQDSKTRENQVFGTAEFLSTQLQKVSEELKVSEDKLKEVKTARQFELPEQRETNLRTLDRLTTDRKTNSEAIDRETTVRMNLETQISQTPQMLPKPVKPTPPAPKNTRYEEYLKAEKDYKDASAKYTPKHPEVLGAKARMDRLKEDVPAELLNPPPVETAVNESATEPNPLYQKLVGQLEEAKTELEIREREKGWIESAITKYNTRIENMPRAEADISEALRQNVELRKQYEDLRLKVSDARLAESLESEQKGAQFQVVDPANYPLLPSKPKKPLVFLGGAAASLLVSFAFAVVVDILRQRIWTQSQIEALWGLPVLVEIPEILTDSDLAIVRRQRLVHAASSAAGALVWSLCLYGIYAKAGFVLRTLDPLLQKVVYK